jgi:hypothetical protein
LGVEDELRAVGSPLDGDCQCPFYELRCSVKQLKEVRK